MSTRVVVPRRWARMFTSLGDVTMAGLVVGAVWLMFATDQAREGHPMGLLLWGLLALGSLIVLFAASELNCRLNLYPTFKYLTASGYLAEVSAALAMLVCVFCAMACLAGFLVTGLVVLIVSIVALAIAALL